MRFAYIDSQGNEVAIPGVDALALRIELCAIGPDTALYDAQADRWGPAHSHEIFHTLSRNADEDGFVAPPPPVAPPPAVSDAREAAAGEFPHAPKHETPSRKAAAAADESLDLTLAPSEPAEEEIDFAGAFEMRSPEPGAPAPGPQPPATSDEAAADETVFDFGDLSGGLELESLPSEESDETTPASHGGAPDAAGGFAGAGTGGANGFAGLETSPDFSGIGSVDDAGGELELEQPMSSFRPDAPPAWMEQDGPGGAEGSEQTMDFSAKSEEAESAERPVRPVSKGPPAGSPPKARAKPSRPRRARRRSSGGSPLIGFLVLAALGAGGYYAWDTFGASFGPAPPRPAVVIPHIPAELVPQMKEMADAALVASFAEIEATASADPPPEPGADWLAGIYLANASQYPGVLRFWEAIEALALTLPEREIETFHRAYLEQTAAAGLEAPVADQLAARADSGFLATRSERIATYALLDDLAEAALELHSFLVSNESAIEYTPARGIAGNPVEEAVPQTDELGDAMWDRVEAITNALDALGTLDKVTRQRLLEVLFTRIREIGIR